MAELTELDVLLRQEERAARDIVESTRETITSLELRLVNARLSLARAETHQSELVQTLLNRNVTPA
jgi:hypothetical protein